MISTLPSVCILLLGSGIALAQMPGMLTQHVQVEKATKGKDTISRTSIGHVEAQKTVHVCASVEGFLKEACFREGGMVKEGDVLFRIDPVRYEAALKQAEAELAKIDAQIAYAQASCNRIERLAATQAASKEGAETAKAKLEQLKAARAEAEANIVTARKDLKDCTVCAEITGRIGRMEFSPGNYITKGEKLATVTQIDPIYVRFPLSQSDVNGIFRGPKQIKDIATLRLTTADGRVYPECGKVEIVDNLLTGSTDSYSLWASFPNRDHVLTHRGVGALQISLNDTQMVTQVPLTAVHHDSTGAYVFIAGEGNKVERREVIAGSIKGRMQSVYAGVEEGEVVVTDGSHKTRVGSVVAPVYPEQQVIRGVQTKADAREAIAVQVTGVTKTTDPTVLTCQGAQVEAIHHINLRPLVQGILEEQLFKEGDRVEKGSVLFSIDSTRYQAVADAQKARIRQLEVRIADARSKYNRQQQLLAAGATSRDDTDSAKATLDELIASKAGAEAALAIAEDDLSRCTIRAGLHGRIGRTTVSPGNYISDIKTPLARLVQLSPIYVRFSLSETAMLGAFGNADRLTEEADITLVTANGETYPETGQVSFSDNIIQTATDTQNVWAVFKNEDRALQPGGVVTIRIKRKPDIRVSAVPAQAVQVGTGGHYVFLLKEGKAVETRVHCGDETEDGLRIIYSGVEEGDKIITSHLAELEDGDAVTEAN